jgi:hypothetical protein
MVSKKKWHYISHLSNIHLQVSSSAKRGFLLKKMGTIIAGLLFLGGFEIAAYPQSGKSNVILVSSDAGQAAVYADVMLVEDGEETEGKREISEYFAVPAFSVSRTPEIGALHKSLSHLLSSEKSFHLQGPRAPPIN